jgi:ABC-type transport system substrate-binding protein
MPGFRSAKIYPRVRPDFARARRLAAGHTRTGKAVMMIRVPVSTAFARARIVQFDLQQIGISVSIVVMNTSNDPSTRGQAYDLLDTGCNTPGHMDPAGILNLSFDGNLIRPAGNTNVGYFDSPAWNRRLEAAARLSGRARYRAYGKLHVDLARTAAPAVAYAVGAQNAFVSKRVGCVRLNPVFGLSLGAMCLR